ncbi:468f3bbc-1dc3-4097-93aa-909784528653 [Sclerotinia trifoliorum]|uniref:468f3bbc-1dc3-4097-93aa-909784528653 n=1 Tax=Sclerotinia trifoliorum TaxID=28548 RepID=A0A8H2W2E2_9HELO|nr:468f3bbc-1dc3-4097-93aa-909784528653 [Sclerotinia trifoliorum]
MLRILRPAVSRRHLSSIMTSKTPYEDIIRTRLTEEFKPTRLEIFNDSSKHSHHKAMAGSTSHETHFRVEVTSEAFAKKMQPARHRMVYALLKEEMAREGGIHALQLKTRTPDEEAREEAREKAKEEGEVVAEASGP